MRTLLQDLRYGLRTLRNGWVATSIAVLSLGLAVGGNTTVFGMVDAFLFRPLPFAEAERVVMFSERQKDQPEGSQFSLSLATYGDLSARSRTMTQWSAVQFRTYSLRNGERSDPVQGLDVTPSFFEVMRVQPFRGRLLRAEDGQAGGARVVVLGHEYWSRTWGDERQAIGTVLIVDGEPHEVVGVLPPDFALLGTGQDLWTPIVQNPATAPRDERTHLAVARMASGVDMEQVRREMVAIAQQLEAEHPRDMRDRTIDSFNLRFDIPNRQTRSLFLLLQGSVALVLLIACVNITNLLLARGQSRAREIAVRTVLGAGQWRIVRLLLAESALMVLGALGLGIALGYAGIRIVSNQFAAFLPAQWQIHLDVRVLAFSAGISVLAGLLFGVMPALQTLRRGQMTTLREGARGGVGRGRRRVTSALVVAEIALSFVALGGGSLLVRSFLDMRSNNTSFEKAHVLTAAIRLPAARYGDVEKETLFADQVLNQARALPGVNEVALTSVLPMGIGAGSDTFRIAGAAVDDARAPSAAIVSASPGYAAIFDVAIHQGRFVEPGDRAGAPPVVVISRSLADARFENGGALGAFIRVRGEDRQVVGIVADVQQSFFQTPSSATGTIYLPVAQAPRGAGVIAVRTSGDPAALKTPLRSAMEELDPDLTVSQLLTMDEFIAQFFVGINVFNSVLGGFGIMALLLAALGTYGVLSYSVGQRRRELGIRMAVGARPGMVVRMIARQGIRLGVIGLAIGLVLTLPLIRVLNALLQGLSTVRPGTLTLIAVLLFGVTLLASWVPASRASRIDPVRTLREE